MTEACPAVAIPQPYSADEGAEEPALFVARVLRPLRRFVRFDPDVVRAMESTLR